MNPGWTFTGKFKNQFIGEHEISLFEVRRQISQTASEICSSFTGDTLIPPTKSQRSKKRDSLPLDISLGPKKTPSDDFKQSFVDAVAEGLLKKVSADRFEPDRFGPAYAGISQANTNSHTAELSKGDCSSSKTDNSANKTQGPDLLSPNIKLA